MRGFAGGTSIDLIASLEGVVSWGTGRSCGCLPGRHGSKCTSYLEMEARCLIGAPVD